MMRTRWVHVARSGCVMALLLGSIVAGSPAVAQTPVIQGGPAFEREESAAADRWTDADGYGFTGPWRDGLAMASGAYQPPPATPARRPLLRRQRPNTISLGVQGSYGVVRGNSRLADGFSDGPGYAFRFRYMLDPSFALGFSFENHHWYDQGGASSNELGAGDSSVTLTTVSVEGVYYLNRESEVNPYFVGGFGHAAPDIVDELRGSTRVNEGIFLMLGVGLERFIRERFSLDLSLRGNALVSNSELTTFATVSAGIHLYPGD
jgi:opacity protein-like surface antigen